MDRLHQDNLLEIGVRYLAMAKAQFARLGEDELAAHLGRGLRMANEIIKRRHTAGGEVGDGQTALHD